MGHNHHHISQGDGDKKVRSHCTSRVRWLLSPSSLPKEHQRFYIRHRRVSPRLLIVGIRPKEFAEQAASTLDGFPFQAVQNAFLNSTISKQMTAGKPFSSRTFAWIRSVCNYNQEAQSCESNNQDPSEFQISTRV